MSKQKLVEMNMKRIAGRQTDKLRNETLALKQEVSRLRMAVNDITSKLEDFKTEVRTELEIQRRKN